MSDTTNGQHAFPKLHNAMWPGLVGKGDDDGQEPPISLEKMLEWTAAAEVDGQKFEGVDYFLFHPHTDPDADDDELKRIADLIAGHDLVVGSLVAPVWPGTVGDSAMGDDESRGKFLDAIRKACRIAGVFNDIGIRQTGVIRIDSAEFGVEKWAEDKIAAAEKELSDVKVQARDLKREMRSSTDPQDQHRIQTKIQELEKSKRRLRQRIFEVEDEILEKRDGMIADIERRLQQDISKENLFTIRWRVV